MALQGSLAEPVSQATSRGPVFVLRPLELKQLFDFAIRLYRLNFAPVLIVNTVVQAIPAVAGIYAMSALLAVATALEQSTATGESFESLGGVLIEKILPLGIIGLLAAIYQLLAAPIGLLITSKLSAQSLLGEPWTLAQAWDFAKRRYWPTQVALATFFLPLLVIAMLMLLPVLAAQMAGASPAAAAITGVVVIFAAIGATSLAYFRFFPALSGSIQACEDPHAFGMLAQGLWYLKRSYALLDGLALRAFGLIFVFGMLVGLVERGVSESAQLAMHLYLLSQKEISGMEQLGQMLQQQDPAVTVVAVTAATLCGLLFQPLYTIYYLLLYVDARFRKEGLDILHALGQVRLPS